MPSAAISPQYGSPEQIALKTGLSRRTVRRLYTSGQLRAQKINRRVLIDYADVEQLIRCSPRNPTLAAEPPSALGSDGRVRGSSTDDAHARVARVLAALSDPPGEMSDDAEQVEEWTQLQAALEENRGGA